MIKQIQSNKIKIDSKNNYYLEDQFGERYYEFCKSDIPSYSRVQKKIDKTYWLIILAVISSIIFTIYHLLSQ